MSILVFEFARPLEIVYMVVFLFLGMRTRALDFEFLIWDYFGYCIYSKDMLV